MSQLPLFSLSTPAWTVTELTHYLRELLSSDHNLQDLWVQGEVSNFSRPSSGHLYFTVKDNSAALKCVMWRNAVLRQDYIPRDGDAVEVHGAIGIYEANGVYQLYADVIRPAGEGLLYQEFLRLKARLEAEGLFDPARKRPIPPWPRTIGIVTSPTGAALRDMLNTLRRRFPLVQVVLAPTPVQGDEAPSGIVQALQSLCQVAHPDLVLVARGGGSIEDLWAFNDERVARAIAACPAPVITGVGHETDFTIADFVADLRAPTPTAAAELATPNRDDLRDELAGLAARLAGAVDAQVAAHRQQLTQRLHRLQLRSPQARLRTDRQRIDDYTRRAATGMAHSLQLHRARLNGLEQRLLTLNPLAVLARGFAVVSHADGQIIRSVAQVRPGDAVTVRLNDGRFEAQAVKTTP
jgi:exodeoxyribonuclease VII large subunit